MSNPERDPPPQAPFGEGLVMTTVSAAQVKYEVSWEWIKNGALELPWWSTGYISMLLLQRGARAWVPSLAGELRPCRPWHPPSKKKKLQKTDALVGDSHVGPMCDSISALKATLFMCPSSQLWGGWSGSLVDVNGSVILSTSMLVASSMVYALYLASMWHAGFFGSTSRGPSTYLYYGYPCYQSFQFFPFCASEQPSKKYILILSYFFFHTKWITKHIDHSFT